MKVFKKMSVETKQACPVCNTLEQKPVVLVSIAGTEDGNITEAVQVHLDCLELCYHKDIGIIVQKL